MLYKDTGIIIKVRDFGEYDKIITFLLNKNGKKDIIAKSIRKPKSRKASSIDIGNVLELSIVETKGIDILSEVKVIYSPANISTDLTKISVINVIMEITDKLIFEEMDDSKLFFDIINQAIRLLDVNDTKLYIIMFVIIIKLLDVSGFISFEKIHGSLSPRAFKSLLYMQKAQIDMAIKLKLNDHDIEEIFGSIKQILEDVLERRIKSLDFLSSIS